MDETNTMDTILAPTATIIHPVRNGRCGKGQNQTRIPEIIRLAVIVIKVSIGSTIILYC
jgi:hypothetical protein